MAITGIQKKTRAAITDVWGPWTATTDAPPYTNTTLVEYRAVETIDIAIADLTNGVIVDNVDGEPEWVGTGVLDVIMRAINGNIKVQYDNGRIRDDAYAEVYLAALQAGVNSSIQFLLGERTSEAQAGLYTKQQSLIDRQTQGFDDDAKQKLLKLILDTWSVAYSVAQDANSIPDSIKVNVIDSIMKNAYTSLGVVKTNDPIGES